jgi:hypothetical protein
VAAPATSSRSRRSVRLHAAPAIRWLVVAQRQHAANVDRTGLSYALVDEAPPETWMPLLSSFSRLGIDEANTKVIGEYFARIDTAAMLAGVRTLAQEWRPDLILRESWEYASALAAVSRSRRLRPAAAPSGWRTPRR